MNKMIKDISFKDRLNSLLNSAKSISIKSNKKYYIIVIDMIISYLIAGFGREDYNYLELWKSNIKIKKTYLSQKKLYNIKFKLHDKLDLFDDKIETLKIFKNFIKRKWIVLNNFKLSDIYNLPFSSNNYILKGLLGCGGANVVKINLNDINVKELEKFANKECLIEECITNHKLINELATSCLCTVRITTFSYNKQIKLARAVLKMPKIQNMYLDNLEQGGICCNVNYDTGVLNAYALDSSGNSYYEHPITKKKFNNFKIPFWNETKQYMKELVNQVDDVKIIGWDVAITDDGPELIEANSHNPAVNLMQADRQPFLLKKIKVIYSNKNIKLDYISNNKDL